MSSITYSIKSITTQKAVELANAVLEHGIDSGVHVSVSVVNPESNELVFIRHGQATAHSRETAKKKALTAASTKRETGWMSGSLEITLPMATGILTNILGGIPIWSEGEIIGAIGVAGGTVEQDASIAKTVLKRLGLLLSSE